MRVIATMMLALVVSGCSFMGGNNLGETRIEAEFQGNSVGRVKAAPPVVEKLKANGLSGKQVAQVMEAVSRPLPKRMILTDGKDKKEITWNLDLDKGRAEYSASDVNATDPSEVKATISEQAGDDAVQAIEKAFPDGVSGLVDTLTNAGE